MAYSKTVKKIQYPGQLYAHTCGCGVNGLVCIILQGVEPGMIVKVDSKSKLKMVIHNPGNQAKDISLK